mgnify:CR=1 FL=1
MSKIDVVNRQVTPKGAMNALRAAFAVRRPVFMWGPPGVGKSDIIHQLGNEMNAAVIDIRLSLWEPTDIKGIPFYDPASSTMKWGSPSELPNEEFAAQYPNVILFLDEMNSAAPSVQAAAYQLILNRRVGQYRLPDNVLIVAAGNRDGDKGVTYRMPAPLANRFMHIEVKVDFDDWCEWAISNKVHKDVVGYLTFSKGDLYDFDPKSGSRAFATPRSWSFVSELLYSKASDDVLLDLVAGTVGEGLALKFSAHRKIASKLPNPYDVLSGKIEKTDCTELSVQCSLAVGMCYEMAELMKKGEQIEPYFNNFIKFMMENFETEVTVMAVKQALSQYNIVPDAAAMPAFIDFRQKYGKYIAKCVSNRR